MSSIGTKNYKVLLQICRASQRFLSNFLQKVGRRRQYKSQTAVLAKHFVLRTIMSDSLEYENQRTELLVFGIVFLTCWGSYIARYSEQLFFMTIMMTVTAICCVVAWDNIFLDNKDYLNVMGLPVKSRTVYLAKFLSILVMIGVISLSFGLMASFIYTTLGVEYTGHSFIYYWFSLLLTNFLANLFVFLLVAAVQSLLMLIFKGKILMKISLLVQVMLLVGLGSVFVWFPKMYDTLKGLSSTFNPVHYYFPPLWFNGLREKMLGNSAEVYSHHLYIAVAALIIPLVLYGLSLPLGLRHLRGSNAGKRPLRFFVYKLIAPVKKIFHALFLRDPVQQAVFYFFIKTLKRSRKQKIHLALIMALPIGFVLTYMIILYNQVGVSNFNHLNLDMIAFPFILYFFLVFGLRTLVEHPVFLDSNWVFKMTQEPEIRPYIKGVKKAMFFYTILPLFVFMFIFYLYFWEFEPALFHSIYGLLTALLLLEVFFFNYRRVPFAALYNPAAVNFKLVWPVFLLLALVYYFLFTNVGLWLILKPRANFIFYVIAGIFFILFRWNNYKNKGAGLVFDEDEEDLNPAMLSLNLS